MRNRIAIFFLLVLFKLSGALPVDSASQINQRFFDPEAIAEASKDYVEEETENSAWQKLMRAISEFLFEAMTSSSKTGDYIYLTLGIIILLIAAFYIMKMQKLWLFSDNDAKDAEFETEILKENIHDLDFEALIAEAEAKGRYNVAVRLLFLQLLKKLSDMNVIAWEVNKTNREYYYEIGDERTRREYDKVSDYFERAWYGEYLIDEPIYNKIKPEFTGFSKNKKIVLTKN